ncbi:hypothetical protein ACHAWF_016771 [Thalassiosira exigua]
MAMAAADARPRRTRNAVVSAVALSFAASYILLFAPSLDVDVVRAGTSRGKSPGGGGAEGAGGSVGGGGGSAAGGGGAGEALIPVFYNLFVPSPADASRVSGILDEQLRALNPALHDVANLSIHSVGHRLPDVPESYLKGHRYEEGGEDRTLHTLWTHCRQASHRDDPNSLVVYLHSKGSFHPDPSNDRLRRFLTEGALSRECAALPDECDVCSSRMSPHPHPHAPGNMWLARCPYVSKLRDPYDARDGKLPPPFGGGDDGCRGYGRYFFEHWVHSHPSVRPCDLYPGREYAWAYDDVPDSGFDKELKRAPRFDFDVYADLLRKSYWYCREDKSPNTPGGYLENRRRGYEALYGTKELDEGWYLWDFLNLSSSSSSLS